MRNLLLLTVWLFALLASAQEADTLRIDTLLVQCSTRNCQCSTSQRDFSEPCSACQPAQTKFARRLGHEKQGELKLNAQWSMVNGQWSKPDTIPEESAFRQNMRKLGKKVKKVVRSFDRYDNDYIEPNHCEWTVMAQNTNFLQIHVNEDLV